MNNKQRFAQNH